MDEPVMAAQPGKGVAENQANGGSDDADEQAFQQKDAADLARLYAHRHENGDVLRLLHHHHGECDQDVQGGHANDEADDDEGDDLLLFEGAEQLAILLHPVGGGVARASGLLDLVANDVGVVKVIDAEGNNGDDVRLAKERLGVREADESETVVILIEAGVKNAGNLEALVFRNK